ncbi:hypothetical protein DSM112329_00415 [Paraconexibacter sp. AEG42_29]|uniref:Right handed beta helix domain-containing protein n=1 Tax=Paraconexibacter sp. AEG42_29 TaxID=2997339 RepID=A0AAU7AQ25_9ACTN
MKRTTLVTALICAALGVSGTQTAVATAATSSATKKAAAKKAAAKKAATKKKKQLLVCRRGCPYSTIQKAVDAAAKNATVKVKPGTYVEGVVLTGHAKDGISIVGLGTKPQEVVLEGKGAKRADGNPAQNGIFVDGADNVTMRNMTAQNYPANGFFVRNCNGYLMDHVVAGFNRAYGLYAFNCIGGRMTYSVGYGHGDSAFYVGQTPFQDKPVPTILDHLEGYENVLGYSGTNSKYVDLRNSEFYNNGAGIAPNTLKSEKFPPAADGIVQENLVYWNNFNYFKAGSSVKPLPAATGGFQYPTGVGIVLLGTTRWNIKNNLVFGNFKWGIMTVSDPTYDVATNRDNKIRFNTMGGPFEDTNGTDVWADGAGSGNCWENQSTGATYDAGALPDLILYPKCGASPQNVIDPAQLAEVAGYLTQTAGQEDSWKKHPHPPRPDRKPIDGLGG